MSTSLSRESELKYSNREFASVASYYITGGQDVVAPRLWFSRHIRYAKIVTCCTCLQETVRQQFFTPPQAAIVRTVHLRYSGSI
jgi:hypothetical protein